MPVPLAQLQGQGGTGMSRPWAVVKPHRDPCDGSIFSQQGHLSQPVRQWGRGAPVVSSHSVCSDHPSAESPSGDSAPARGSSKGGTLGTWQPDTQVQTNQAAIGCSPTHRHSLLSPSHLAQASLDRQEMRSQEVHKATQSMSRSAPGPPPQCTAYTYAQFQVPVRVVAHNFPELWINKSYGPFPSKGTHPHFASLPGAYQPM